MKWRNPADRNVVQAVLACFREPREDAILRLQNITSEQWSRSLFWMDAAGMSLYLHRRIEQMRAVDILPPSLIRRWDRNKVENQQRCAALFAEMRCINEAFADRCVSFANVKGFTLFPHACPDVTLRSQLDLDFAIAREDVEAADVVLRSFGYRLTGFTNRVREYKRGSTQLQAAEDRYRVPKSFSVEVHFESGGDDPRLARRVWHLMDGLQLPAFRDADIFVGQATHLLSHLTGPTTRLSWLLEFGWNAEAHAGDAVFWSEARTNAMEATNGDVALGLSSYLCNKLLGQQMPTEMDEWNEASLSPAVRRWARIYGERCVVADVPGTKLYLLLQEELHRNQPAWRAEKLRRLLPRRPAPRITVHVVGQGAKASLLNALIELRFLFFRLRFHAVEGARYCVHGAFWKLWAMSSRQCDPAIVAKPAPYSEEVLQ